MDWTDSVCCQWETVWQTQALVVSAGDRRKQRTATGRGIRAEKVLPLDAS